MSDTYEDPENEDGQEHEMQDPLDALNLSPSERAAAEDLLSPNFDRAKLEKKIFNRYGIESDELKTLYPKDEDLQLFYRDLLRKSYTFVEDDEENDPEDDYVPTSDNKRELDEIREREAKKAKKMEKKILGNIDEEQKKKFEELQQQLPEESRVSIDELVAGIKEGFNEDFDEE